MTDFISTQRQKLLPLRAQADLRNDWLRERLDTLLPELMARAGFDAWIVAAREYNEDPVIMSLLPEPAMAARRRAILLRERDPQRIGINISEDFAFGDGLTYTEYQQLAAALGGDLMSRAVGAERLVLGWLERRIPAEIEHYPAMIALGHAVIAEAFSARTITPSVTTTDDVVWWMRQTMHDLGLRAWFQPTI